MLRLIIVAVLSASALSASVDLDREWMFFKKVYNKQYTPEDEPFRRVIWEANLRFIEKHNLEADNGRYTYRLGMNPLGDLSSKELRTMMNGYKKTANRTAGGATYLPPSNVGDLPSQVDWRTKGYVTRVKDQGQCGSCWAFSATGSLEGQHFKKTGKLVSLSEQNLVDCSQNQGNMGCQGGLMDQAFEYIKVNGGIDTEQSYPYTAKDGICRFSPSNVGATVTGYTDITRGSEADLQSAVATVGPISVAIDASHPSFQFYTSGVYYEPNCSSTALDHGVLAVGYGTDGLNDYWLVKNSWGAIWGMAGYIKMSRNNNNNCGIASQASYPLV